MMRMYSQCVSTTKAHTMYSLVQFYQYRRDFLFFFLVTFYFSFVTASFFFVFRLYQTRASSSSLRAWAKRAFDFVCWLFSLRGGATFPK